MITKKLLKDLKGYEIVGRHSAVKTCFWLKKSLKNEGVCYKQKFYGIQSHRCLQMTPALICNQHCVHCWRPLELLTNIEGWDDPEFIVEESIKAQRKLLSGFWGNEEVDKKKLEEAYNPNQVAISLIGEPTLYPYLPELVEEFKKRGFTTFVVSNGTRPEMIESVEPTQLYISLTAYDEESHLRLNRPVRSFWDNIMKSLEIMSQKTCRTVIRLTLIKGYNMDAEKFAPLIEKASPMFVETKAYMYLGYSRLRLPREAMPEHEEVRRFAEELAKITGYEIADESVVSRVVLLKAT
ncbi:MAG TPA: 4-demethylwyosine synthase TYW1 [Archaeoglobus profundus]|nr:4-demethylwyosine synthase TYW1 [Archaeoglobus profundus]